MSHTEHGILVQLDLVRPNTARDWNNHVLHSLPLQQWTATIADVRSPQALIAFQAKYFHQIYEQCNIKQALICARSISYMTNDEQNEVKKLELSDTSWESTIHEVEHILKRATDHQASSTCIQCARPPLLMIWLKDNDDDHHHHLGQTLMQAGSVAGPRIPECPVNNHCSTFGHPFDCMTQLTNIDVHDSFRSFDASEILMQAQSDHELRDGRDSLGVEVLHFEHVADEQVNNNRASIELDMKEASNKTAIPGHNHPSQAPLMQVISSLPRSQAELTLPFRGCTPGASIHCIKSSDLKCLTCQRYGRSCKGTAVVDGRCNECNAISGGESARQRTCYWPDPDNEVTTLREAQHFWAGEVQVRNLRTYREARFNGREAEWLAENGIDQAALDATRLVSRRKKGTRDRYFLDIGAAGGRSAAGDADQAEDHGGHEEEGSLSDLSAIDIDRSVRQVLALCYNPV